MHKDFIPATWRGTTRVNTDGFLGLSLNTENGIARFKIDVQSAKDIVETVGFYLEQNQSNLTQSDKESEIPSVEVSTVPADSQCPPVNSSSKD